MCFVWVWNSVFHIKGETQNEDVWEQCAEENIGIQEGGSGGRLEKTA
jgi:hypothetical protein